MISSVFIIAVSALLLAYWFRYTCLLILRSNTAKDYAASAATANGFTFGEVRSKLLEEAPLESLPAQCCPN